MAARGRHCIDPGLQHLIPPLHPDELALLEESLRREGCREALVVWAEEGVLIDGHNRHSICERLGIPYQTVARSFASRGEAELWVIENQLGRRNLADIDRIALAAKREPLIRAQAAAHQGRRTDLPQNSAEGPTPMETREAAAATASVSHDTYTKGKRILECGVPELVQAVREGRASIHAASAIAELGAAEQRAAVVAGGNIVEAARKARAHLTRSTGCPEWHTPEPYLDAARDVLGEIDLDPASNEVAQKRVRASLFFTAEDDGLAWPWRGRLWLNPPFGHRLIDRFVHKLIEAFETGDVPAAIMLTNDATDTSWWQDAAAAAAAICFTRGRIRFERSSGKVGSPLQGQCFFYFGSDVPRFAERFGEFGQLVRPFGRADARPA